MENRDLRAAGEERGRAGGRIVDGGGVAFGGRELWGREGVRRIGRHYR